MTALLVTVAGCGGGGSGSNHVETPAPPPPPPPPPDKYEASSYSSEGTSNQTLTGLWMMVEQSQITKSFLPSPGETKRRRRSTVNIVDHGDGTATVYNCVDTTAEISIINLNGSVIQLPVDNTLLQATIVNNQRLEGTFVAKPVAGMPTPTVSGTATLIKIDDRPSLPEQSGPGLGTVSAQVTESGTLTRSFDNKKIYCFTQEEYDVTLYGGAGMAPGKRTGNAIEFFSLSRTPVNPMPPVPDGLIDVEIFYDGQPAPASEVVLSTPPLATLRNTTNPTLNLTDDSMSAFRGEVIFTDMQSSTTSTKIQFQIGL